MRNIKRDSKKNKKLNENEVSFAMIMILNFEYSMYIC